MQASHTDTRHQRERMVKEQIEARGIRDPEVVTALLQVPREAFLPDEVQEFAYLDVALPILVGFGTDHGTVAAASNWGEEAQIMRVRGPHADSYERLFHETGLPACLLPLRRNGHEMLREELIEPRLERAISVVYRPNTELLSHYFQVHLPLQFDEYIWFDETTAVTPLCRPHAPSLPQTHPFALLDE